MFQLKRALLIFTGLLIATTAGTVHARPYANIEMVGASNTAGVGASAPLLARLRRYLQTSPLSADLQRELSGPRILISIDYFFPSNFTALDDPNADVQSLVRSRLAEWTSHYDQVYIARLPTWDHLSPIDQRYCRDFDLQGGYANVMDILDAPERRAAVAVVNRTLLAWAATHPTVHVLDFNSMIDASRVSATPGLNRPAPWVSEDLFGPDLLHLNDFGQVHILNSVVLPALDRRLPAMKFEKVSDEERLEMLRETIDPIANYLSGRAGTYWLQFTTRDRFRSANAQIRGAGPGRSLLEDVAWVTDMGVSMGDPGIPLVVSNADGQTHLALDLSHAYFFGLVPLTETAPGIFEAWAYDYWSSLHYLKIWAYMETPHTNYHFVLRRTSQPSVFRLEFTVYPGLPGQPKDLIRVYQDPPAVRSQIQTEALRQPSLIYTDDLTLTDPQGIHF